MNNKFTPFNQCKDSRLRVNPKLPPIETCNNCGSCVFLETNDYIYGKQYGKYPWIYVCINPDCDSYVGIHPNTDIPLGTIANKVTREARKTVKHKFIMWYENNNISRNLAYKLLAGKMQILREDCHFGLFSVDDCNKANSAINCLIGEQKND